MYNHNKAQQSKNRVHISWDILYVAHYAVVQILFLNCIITELILGLRPANERRGYFVTTPLIGWAQT